MVRIHRSSVMSMRFGSLSSARMNGVARICASAFSLKNRTIPAKLPSVNNATRPLAAMSGSLLEPDLTMSNPRSGFPNLLAADAVPSEFPAKSSIS